MGLFGRGKGPRSVASGPPGQVPMPFRNAAAMSAPYPMGHAPAHLQQQLNMQLQAAMREIATMKNAPVLNPNFGMIPRYLESLNRMLEPVVVLKGPMAGQRQFMMEVQLLIRKIRDRVFNRGIPLSPQEREAIASYSRHWQMSRGGPADMGRPETQIVLLSLAECAQI